MISLQCCIASRVINVPHTSKVALPLLVAFIVMLFAAPRCWWYLMTVAGCLAPLLTWLVAEFSERPVVEGTSEPTREVQDPTPAGEDGAAADAGEE
eukprot:symbB.v1.2.010117.t2/scaffold658.1/size175746/7